jgi:hypothetical protein
MLDTSSVDQAGVTWNFTIAPNASVAPSVVSGVAVTGASPNLSSVLSAGIKAPRFNFGTSAYGYADAEVTNPVLGSTYFNTGTVCGVSSLRQYSNIGWACGSSLATSPTGSAKPKGRSGSAESIYYQTLADGSMHAWLMSANKAVWVDQVNQDVVYAGSATLMGVTNAYEMNEGTGTTLHDSVGTTELNFYSTAPTWNGTNGLTYNNTINQYVIVPQSFWTQHSTYLICAKITSAAANGVAPLLGSTTVFPQS